MLFNFFNLYPTTHCNVAKPLQYTKLSKNGQYRSLSSLLVSYSKDRKEPIILSKPQVPANMSPWFITGYTDAEACFDFNILKSRSVKIGLSVVPRFRITAHKRDIVLLFMIKEYFNCGTIGKIDDKDCLKWKLISCFSFHSVIIFTVC